MTSEKTGLVSPEHKSRMVGLAEGLGLLHPYVYSVDPSILQTHHEYVLVSGIVDLPLDTENKLREYGWSPWSPVDPDAQGVTWGYSTCL